MRSCYEGDFALGTAAARNELMNSLRDGQKASHSSPPKLAACSRYKIQGSLSKMAKLFAASVRFPHMRLTQQIVDQSFARVGPEIVTPLPNCHDVENGSRRVNGAAC